MKLLHSCRIHPRRPQRAFTLVELTMVLVIVALLLGGVMAMVSAQTEQRKWRDTQSQLEGARDALLGYAIANGRLPCPATSGSAGAEVRVTATGVCGTAGNDQDYYGGVVSGVTYGLLPAVTLGYQPVDTEGYALDEWGNRIRYAVSKVTTPSFTANFTYKDNLKTNGVSVLPNDLVVCASSTGILPGNSPPSCGATTNSVTSQNTVVAILYSPGKNGKDPITLGADEAANENRSATNDAVFISHTPAPSGATGGEFDDQVLWLSVGTLYSKLVAAQVLP